MRPLLLWSGLVIALWCSNGCAYRPACGPGTQRGGFVRVDLDPALPGVDLSLDAVSLKAPSERGDALDDVMIDMPGPCPDVARCVARLDVLRDAFARGGVRVLAFESGPQAWRKSGVDVVVRVEQVTTSEAPLDIGRIAKLRYQAAEADGRSLGPFAPAEALRAELARFVVTRARDEAEFDKLRPSAVTTRLEVSVIDARSGESLGAYRRSLRRGIEVDAIARAFLFQVGRGGAWPVVPEGPRDFPLGRRGAARASVDEVESALLRELGEDLLTRVRAR